MQRPTETIAQMFAERYLACAPLPVPSRLVENLDLEMAYTLQRAFVQRLVDSGCEVAGYKAGLTSRPTQKNFGATGPVSGVLFAHGRVTSGGSVELECFGKMLLEVEVGYIMARDVDSPTTPRKVSALVEEVVGVVEIADLNLESMEGLSVADIVAVNIGSRSYAVGEGVDPGRIRISEVAGALFKDGTALGRPINSRAALGGQWKALAWTINNVLAQGWEVRKGMLIITGALGSPWPGSPGSYEARYTGGLGGVCFSVL